MRKWFLLSATIILLVAAFLRLSQLATYPPGPHFDEAANILITRSIAFDGANLFPIANSYQGRESLYYYLNVPVFRLIGDDIFAFRLSSAFINLLTIAASMALGRMMFREQRGVMIGLLVGGMMAVSFHQIFMSRQAYRAVTLPMMQALGLAFLWRGLQARQRDWLWLALGGIFAGGAIYTYMASRLFPLWLALGGIALLWFDRGQWRLRLRQGAIFFSVMLLTMLPMLLYALDNPDVFFQRLDEVTEGEVTVTLAESVRRHLEMFFIRGDSGNLRYNDPGRPYFTPIEGIALLIGLGVAVWRLLRGTEQPAIRAAYVLVLLSPLMVIPSVVSVAGFPPSHMRSLGMVPLIFVLVALGFEAALSAIIHRWPEVTFTKPRVLGVVGLLTLIVASGIVYETYISWAKRADLFYQADGDLALAAKWLPTQADGDTRVYVASYHREHPTLITGWAGTVTWLGGDSLFLPPLETDALALFMRNAPPPDSWRLALEPERMPDVPLGPDGEPAFWAYHLTADAPLDNLVNTDEPVRNPLLAFAGISADPAPAGDEATITTAWAIQQTPPYYSLRPVFNLIDRHSGMVISSADVFLLGTNSWRPGETIIQQVALDVPVGTPPDTYGVAVSWVDRDSGEYVSYINGDDTLAGITAEIGELRVTRPDSFPSPDVLPIQHREVVDIAEGIRLLGWNTFPASARPGQTLQSVLYWQATPTDSSGVLDDVRVLLRSDGSDRTEDAVIWQGEMAYPPDRWIDQELVTHRDRWSIPREQANSDYQLILQIGDQEIVLSDLRIEGQPRLFAPPDVVQRSNARYGDSFMLYGYSLIPDEGGMTLELVWQSLRTVELDYTVFVHLVDASGTIIEQFDQMPQNYAYPTSLWAEGEYIVDSYHFTTPGSADDNLSLRIGLTIQETGDRLAVYHRQNEVGMSDFLIIPPDVMKD